MSSKLPVPPSSASRLKPPSRLPAACSSSNMSVNKRLASESSNQEPPSKKVKESGSNMGPPPTRLAAPGLRKNMRRSVSMASLAVSSNIRTKARGATGSTLSRNISGSTLSVADAGGTRRVGTNITSRINNTRSNSVSAGSSIRRTSSTSKNVGSVAASGKVKRKPWDLKGQLQDKEKEVEEMRNERGVFSEKIELIEKRLDELSHEKQNLDSHLTESESTKMAKLKELEEAYRKYDTLKESSESDIRRLKETVEEKDSQLDRMKRQIKELQTDLDIKSEEIVKLKKSFLEVTNSISVLEAQRDSEKIKSESLGSQVSDLQSQLTDACATIEQLKEKVRLGEDARKKLHNKVLELKGNIRVFCRIRPLLNEEVTKNGSDEIFHLNVLTENSLEMMKDAANCDVSSMSGLKGRGNGALEFSYDRVFGPKNTQTDVFEEVSQLVQSALDGYNVCVFAYGQTGSGKTFTMEGVPDSDENAGIIPRTVDFIYQQMTTLKESGWEYSLEATFLEIYNESIRDLLVPQSEAKVLTYDIKMSDSKSPLTHVTNLKVITITSPEDIYNLLSTAHKNRAVAATNMNLQSSRSHSVFRMVLSGHNLKTGEIVQGSLNLVDLAGSERLKESGSTGARLTETQNINKSLSNLGNVIMALGQKQPHIPYRNSKLTHLLQPCLGGNSKTLMLVNVSPLEMCANETLNSLRFATKVNSCHIGTATKQAKKV